MDDDRNKGYIKLSRGFFEHPLWNEKRELSRAEAWLDLIRRARYSHEETGQIINGQLIKWRRGQLLGSVRFLQEAWGWKSTKKVRSFLKMLENEHMIETRKTQGVTVITLINYDTYNPSGQPADTGVDPQKTQQGHSKDTVKTQNSNKGNKGNNEESKISFEQFWDLYGKKKGAKPKCQEKWNRLPLETQQLIIDKLPAWKSQFKKDVQFQPYPHTFLNQGYYESEDFVNAGEPQLNGQSETTGVKMETI